MHQFHKFILAWNSTRFGQFVCPSSGVYSLYIQQWCMSYMFVESFRAGPGLNCTSILVLLESCLQTCMTYNSAECTVNKLLMMDRGTVRNMWSDKQFVKLVHLVGFIIKKFVTMHGHINVRVKLIKIFHIEFKKPCTGVSGVYKSVNLWGLCNVGFVIGKCCYH